MTCGTANTFILSYANATAPNAPNAYTFQTKSEGNATGHVLTALTAGSPTVTVNAGTATKLVFSTQPGNATAGAPFGQQPVVKTQDSVGNNSMAGLPAHLDVTVTLSAGTGPLQGTTTLDIGTAAGNGTVSYTNLRIDSPGTNKELTASASGLTPAVSNVFTVTAGALDSIVISPDTATIAAGDSQDYTAEGFDANGNSLGDVTGDTTFTASGAATCSGNSCTASSPGDYTITGDNGGKTDEATLTVTAGALTITGFTPSSGPVGTTVTITGTAFTGASAVRFSGVSATFTVDSSTQITATVPSGAVTGKIKVTTAGGTATSATSFKVT
jgi:hypothetical protein